MKKLNVLTLTLFLISMAFVSCEEGLNVNIDATFQKKITANIVDSKKSEQATPLVPFFVMDSLDISEEPDVQDNIERLKDLEVKKVTCTLTGIPENQSISELNITIPETGLAVTLNSINENNNTVTLDITPELLNALAQFLYSNYQITIIVSGFSTYAPMQLGVELSFDSTLVTGL